MRNTVETGLLQSLTRKTRRDFFAEYNVECNPHCGLEEAFRVAMQV